MALARRLLGRAEADFPEVSAAATTGTLLLLGDTDSLPWVDGGIYLGTAPGSGELLLPTSLVPSLPEELLASALAYQFPELAAPLALLPSAQIVLPAGGARPLSRTLLELWLSAEEAR